MNAEKYTVAERCAGDKRYVGRFSGEREEYAFTVRAAMFRFGTWAAVEGSVLEVNS